MYRHFTCSRHEGVWESRGIAPLVLNLHTRWRRGFNFTLRPPYLRERTPVPFEKEARLGERENRSLRSWEDKYLLILRGFEPRSAQPLANYCIDYVSFVQSGSLQAFLVVQVKSSPFCDTARRHWVTRWPTFRTRH